MYSALTCDVMSVRFFFFFSIMERNDRRNVDIALDKTDEAVTEDILIERAKLSRSELNRDFSSSSSADSYKQQLPLNEEVLIRNAILVKSVSLKTTSTVSVDTDKTEDSGEDEVFQTSMDREKEEDIKKISRDKTVSDVENKNVQDIGDISMQTPTAGITGELRDNLQESQSIIIPRINIVDVEDAPSGCRTPANSIEEISENSLSEHAKTKHFETENKTVAQITKKVELSQDEFDREEGKDRLTEMSTVSAGKDWAGTMDDEPTDVDFDELVIDIANAISGPEFEAIKSALKSEWDHGHSGNSGVITFFFSLSPFPNDKFWSLPNSKTLQMTILNLMKIAESSPKEQITLWEKEKLLVTSNFSFSQRAYRQFRVRIHPPFLKSFSVFAGFCFVFKYLTLTQPPIG